LVSALNKSRLTIIAAVLYWITTALSIAELVVEGSSFFNWLLPIIFLLCAIYFTTLAVKNRQA
jgi:hypothetical protein